jgi:Sulfotransferase family
MWPNFYIVGAAKCGTTSVWAYLKNHPQVFLPEKPEKKEPTYFVTAPVPSHYVPGIYYAGDKEGYLRLYEGAGGYKAVGDASPGYLWDVNAPHRIHDVCPGARIVIMLRDPVERAHSHYLRQAWWGIEPLSFLEAIKRDHSGDPNNWWNRFMYVEIGLYHEQVKRYIETFGRAQVAIYLLDELEKDSWGVMSAICRHIGVDPALLDKKELRRLHNPSRQPRFKWLYSGVRRIFPLKVRKRILSESMRSWMSYNPVFYKPEKPNFGAEAAKYLQSIYEPDVCRLEELLDRKLPELRKSWI